MDILYFFFLKNMLFFFTFFFNFANGLIWIEPSADLDYNCNQNQAFQSEVGKTYFRLPPRAQSIVRPRIWQLSRHSASISIKFITNSSHIKIQYDRENPNNFAMMNQIGTSGIDLYGYDENGTIHFFAGTYSFGSRVTFDFSEYNKSVIFSYLLILPSYDVIKPNTLKIGYEEDSYFKIFETELEKPITLYGTSIMHGACPNRPGLSWVNWVSRTLQLPVHNFGFMGQGMLEKEVIDLVMEEEARAFVLDCLPNLVFEPVNDVINLTIEAYKQIRAKWPDTPIILVEFGGYTNYEFSNQYRTYTDNMNTASREALKKLQEEYKATNLFYVTQEELGITSDDISDPVHPMDNGMQKQTNAIVKVLREALNMPESVSHFTTQIPVPQHRNLNFFNDHQKVLKKLNAQTKISENKVIIGDSFAAGLTDLDGYLNLGMKDDRIENALYRIYHDEMSNMSPQKIVTFIGSNNVPINGKTEIVEGIKFLLQQIHARQPEAALAVVGILPRTGYEETVKNINLELKSAAEKEGWSFADPGQGLLDGQTGLIDKQYFLEDGFNLNSQGYEVIKPVIAAL